MAAGDVVIEHPNREKAASKLTRLVVVVLLLASALIDGDHLRRRVGPAGRRQGAAGRSTSCSTCCSRSSSRAGAAACCRWRPRSRSCSASSRWSRCRAGSSATGRASAEPALSADVVGLLDGAARAAADPLIVFAMRGFQQAWNVEVERPADARREGRRRTRPAAQHAGRTRRPLPRADPARPRRVRPRLLPRPPGWWNWSDTTASKAVELRLVRVRVPPRVSCTRAGRAALRQRRGRGVERSRSPPACPEPDDRSVSPRA